METSLNPADSLRLHPVSSSLSRFGLNPYGENLYRIVFGPSRLHMIYGTWPNGLTKAKMIPRYPQSGSLWIMERWVSGREYAGCTPEQWEAKGLGILGAFPERGEYEICHEFFAADPEQCGLDKLISVFEMSYRNRNYWVNRTALQDEHETEKQQTRNLQMDMIRSRLPAFGTAPMSGYGGGRSQKTAPILKSAQELGLPTRPGLNARKPRKTDQKFQIALQ